MTGLNWKPYSSPSSTLTACASVCVFILQVKVITLRDVFRRRSFCWTSRCVWSRRARSLLCCRLSTKSSVSSFRCPLVSQTDMFSISHQINALRMRSPPPAHQPSALLLMATRGSRVACWWLLGISQWDSSVFVVTEDHTHTQSLLHHLCFLL